MHTAPDSGTARGTSPRGWLRYVAIVVVVAAVVVLWTDPAQAATLAVPPPHAPPQTLDDVIQRLTGFLVGLLVSLATLFLTVAGVRYVAADGDPGEIERAKKSLRSALLGYGIALLAPMLIDILRGLVS